ncbi:hypothetical protein F8388_018111 [Cannabis sativa]|uniref:Uncharacterized protein n=1 Tax=Cannabis sativa TaxID=3483 RepID=A0A7J6E6N7_CANSA|nr:hypothetical protein G4B88_022107 [Cannabis sativa]KAF4395837.1 hypothetical protein F8388_018111 [Cannabis sativa]
MDNQRNPLLGVSWAYYCHGKNVEDELRSSLCYAKLELDQTRVALQDELRKKDDQLSHLRDLLNKTIREKDEVQEKCRRLIWEKLLLQQQQQQQQQQTAPLSGISSIDDEPRRGIDSNNGFSSSDCEESIVSSPVMDQIHQTQLPSPPAPAPAPPSISEAALDLVCDKSLPEKGKLLQAVMKAGPLLQTLLLAGPLPQWRHPPPPLESFEIPPVTIPSPPPPPPPPTATTQVIFHQDSLINNFNGCSNAITNCGRVNRKRVLCDGSDSPTEAKYQRIVLH